MTNTRILRGIFAAFALLLLTVACGGNTDTYVSPPPITYCVGPERIDDLGDLLHREMVRYPDEYCAGPMRQGFAIVSAPDYVSVPDFGETVLADPYWGYHRSYHPGRSTVVVYHVKDRNPPRSSVLLVREPTVGASRVRAEAASRAAQARRAGVSGAPSGTTAGPSGSSTVSRGGLGVSGSNADKADTASQARLKAQTDAASRAAAAGRSKSTTSSSKPSTSTASASKKGK